MPGTEDLADLEHHWDGVYVFTYSSRPGNRNPYTAIGRNGRGAIRAADPETLFDAVMADYREHPVPREVAP